MKTPVQALAIILPFLLLATTHGVTRRYKFDVRMTRVTRLCATKSVVTINNRFPGPRIVAREGDRVLVEVVNHVNYNVTIHWHGVRQVRSGWADGPAYITQCPIQTGQTYVYNFTVNGQRGTLWWHAHISWLRSTLYGAIVILPKLGVPYPFGKPYKEITIVFGEWWKSDTEAVISEALRTGASPNLSDAYTINGLPGPSYNCSAKDTFKLKLSPGRNYLLRLASAVLQIHLFFGIADHNLTVVEADAAYTKPFTTDVIHIAPGQTTNVLLRANPHPTKATFLISASPFSVGPAPFVENPVLGIVEYNRLDQNLPILHPTLPRPDDTHFVDTYSTKLRSLNNAEYPANVPLSIDRHFLFTAGLGTVKCPRGHVCGGPNGAKFVASINNVSFVLPTTALLEAHYERRSRGVYSPDFPSEPLRPFDYTGEAPKNTAASLGTKVEVLAYNTSVELVLQGTCLVAAESHPLHLHGFNFFVVGRGVGNYNHRRDRRSFNLVDPVERNTVDVPAGGWVAIRFVADNPGVWLMHCHFEVHTSWGLMMAWAVSDGKLPWQKLPPPPLDLPKC